MRGSVRSVLIWLSSLLPSAKADLYEVSIILSSFSTFLLIIAERPPRLVSCNVL